MSDDQRYQSLTLAEELEAIKSLWWRLWMEAFRPLRIRWLTEGLAMKAAGHDAEWARLHREALIGRRNL